MVEEAIVKTIQNYLKNLESAGMLGCYVVVFGSYAEGCQNALSDIDVLVVSSCFDGEVQRKDVNLLWHVAARTDSRIEPIPVGMRQFVEDDSSAILEVARRHGQKISLAA